MSAPEGSAHIRVHFAHVVREAVTAADAADDAHETEMQRLTSSPRHSRVQTDQASSYHSPPPPVDATSSSGVHGAPQPSPTVADVSVSAPPPPTATPAPPAKQPTPSIALTFGVVACGGALGALLRYAFTIATSSFDRLESFVTAPAHPWSDGAQAHVQPTRFIPVATLLANVIGCLLIGIFSAVLSDSVLRAHLSPLWRPFLVTGICGGLTTFSTMALETIQLVLQAVDAPDRAWMPIVNLLLQHILCIAAVVVADWLTVKSLPLIPAYQRVKAAATPPHV